MAKDLRIPTVQIMRLKGNNASVVIDLDILVETALGVIEHLQTDRPWDHKIRQVTVVLYAVVNNILRGIAHKKTKECGRPHKAGRSES